MSKIYIINGSPRKDWNTAKMCKSFAEGANNSGAETEIINLYDIDFKGCRSCFACKLKGGKSFSKCSYPDGLTTILEKISQADGIILASPIYFGEVSGEMRSFTERLLFPFFQYKEGYPSTAPKKLKTAVIYTMNVPENAANKMYPDMMKRFEWAIGAVFTRPIRICAFDTYQFSDYSKYEVECFSHELKAKQREEQFPKDLQTAYLAGVRMAEEI